MIPVEDFYPRVAHVARGCPTPVLRDAVVAAAEVFCERTWLWEQETPEPIQTMEGQQEYVLFAPWGSDILAIKSVTLDGQTARFTTPDRRTVRLWDDPGAGKALSAALILKPTRAATELPDFLLNHLDAISAGARSRLLDMGGTDWFAPQLADKYRAEFEKLFVPRARVEVAHRAGYDMRVSRRRFI